MIELKIDEKAGTFTITGKINGKNNASLPASSSGKMGLIAGGGTFMSMPVIFDGKQVKMSLTIGTSNKQ